MYLKEKNKLNIGFMCLFLWKIVLYIYNNYEYILILIRNNKVLL